MPSTSKQKKVAGVSSDAVEKATGLSWEAWLRALDKAKAAAMTHKEIVKLLRDNHDVSHWWAQTITVGYEQERGMRDKHEKPGGFEVSVSKTVSVPVSRLFQAWSDERARKSWLDEHEFEVRKATADKSLRITWVDGRTHVDVYFWEKGKSKSSVQVNHKKLSSGAEAEKVKAQWRDRLVELAAVLSE